MCGEMTCLLEVPAHWGLYGHNVQNVSQKKSVHYYFPVKDQHKADWNLEKEKLIIQVRVIKHSLVFGGTV